MKKKLKRTLFIGILSLFISVNCYAAEQSSVDFKNLSSTVHGTGEFSITDNQKLEDKLIAAFPHLENKIISASNKGIMNKRSMNAQNSGDIVYRESKWISEEELLGIAFDKDGAYSAYNLLVGEGSKTWIDGTSSSGSGYRNIYDATLMVSNSYYLYTVTITPISYSVVNNGYDSFLETGVATSPIMPYLTASPVQMKETADTAAYAYYNATNVLKIGQSSEVNFPIEIRISNNNVYVYLFGSRI